KTFTWPSTHPSNVAGSWTRVFSDPSREGPLEASRGHLARGASGGLLRASDRLGVVLVGGGLLKGPLPHVGPLRDRLGDNVGLSKTVLQQSMLRTTGGESLRRWDTLCIIYADETRSGTLVQLDAPPAVPSFGRGISSVGVRLAGMQGFFDLTQQYKPEHPPLLTTSSAAEIALAKHLKASGAMCYTAWWCPHCQESSGSSSGERRPRWGRLCSAPARSGACWPSARTSSKSGVCPSRIMGDGKKHSGIQALSELAEYSGFTAFPKDSFRERTDQESWSTSGAPRTPSRPRASPAATTTTTSERRCRGAGTAARAPLGGAPARRCTGNGRPSDGKARGAAVASRWPRVALAFSSGEAPRPAQRPSKEGSKGRSGVCTSCSWGASG
ncbi:unnamed protein product, partial [Prorocentrum cordatum]